MNLLRSLTIAVSGILCLVPVFAQNYPSKPVKIIVPATTGGAIDIIARVVAEKISGPLGQTVIVDNKPGAANNLGTDLAAKSPPDGHTIVIVASSHATNKFLYKNLGWDPIRDFEPIVYTHVVPLVLAVNPAVPAKNVPELITWIKQNPSTANFASSGTGSSLHMAAELFMSMSSTKMQHVPYKGSSAAHPDLLAGRTAMIFDTLAAIQSHVKAGNVRALAVTTATRSPALPEVPTVAEAALKGYEASTWGGFLAPAKTPKPIIQKLNALINAALQNEEVKSKLAASGIQLQGGSPEAFATVIANEVEKWGKVVAAAGIQAE
ncbi:MAG: hypothetical protein RLZZ502_1022 [Pseudomonadota bacterium]